MSKMPHAEAVLPLTVASESAAEEALCRHWYEAHGSAVYNYFRFLVTAPDEAEELTAETFLRVVRHAGRFDENKASARTWILRIARNVMRDQWRTDRRRKRAPVESLRDLEFESPSPEERLIREEEVAQVLAGIARLPEADQERLYALLKAEIPRTTVVSIGHRESLAEHHAKRLRWRDGMLVPA